MSKRHQAAHTANPGGVNFLITIHHQENHSWQGIIEWLDTGKKIHFRSELELMQLLHEATQTTQKEAVPFRTWDDAKSWVSA
jgi:alpha-D-ribose 1-methylphosphonate 5-triphosphate synthase subunit PhnI